MLKKLKPLTYRQSWLLTKAPTDWEKLPGGYGPTNSTMNALENRNLIELRITPGEEFKFFCGWQWRKVPQ